jgi:hypothetical protein
VFSGAPVHGISGSHYAVDLVMETTSNRLSLLKELRTERLNAILYHRSKIAELKRDVEGLDRLILNVSGLPSRPLQKVPITRPARTSLSGLVRHFIDSVAEETQIIKTAEVVDWLLAQGISDRNNRRSFGNRVYIILRAEADKGRGIVYHPPQCDQYGFFQKPKREDGARRAS